MPLVAARIMTRIFNCSPQERTKVPRACHPGGSCPFEALVFAAVLEGYGRLSTRSISAFGLIFERKASSFPLPKVMPAQREAAQW